MERLTQIRQIYIYKVLVSQNSHQSYQAMVHIKEISVSQEQKEQWKSRKRHITSPVLSHRIDFTIQFTGTLTNGLEAHNKVGSWYSRNGLQGQLPCLCTFMHEIYSSNKFHEHYVITSLKLVF